MKLHQISIRKILLNIHTDVAWLMCKQQTDAKCFMEQKTNNLQRAEFKVTPAIKVKQASPLCQYFIAVAQNSDQ